MLLALLCDLLVSHAGTKSALKSPTYDLYRHYRAWVRLTTSLQVTSIHDRWTMWPDVRGLWWCKYPNTLLITRLKHDNHDGTLLGAPWPIFVPSRTKLFLLTGSWVSRIGGVHIHPSMIRTFSIQFSGLPTSKLLAPYRDQPPLNGPTMDQLDTWISWIVLSFCSALFIHLSLFTI